MKVSEAASRRFPAEEEAEEGQAPAVSAPSAALAAPEDREPEGGPTAPKSPAPWETIAFDPLDPANEPSPDEQHAS